MLDPGKAAPELRLPNANGDVALLIDWENLKWSLRNNYGATPRIGSLVNAARSCGRLVLARAYADWTLPLLREDAPALYRAGIEPVYIPGHHAEGTTFKNSADVRMAVDAADLGSRLEHILTYVFVTGDRDLIHALNFLRLRGRRVVVVAVGDTLSIHLAAAADAVLRYERDVEELSVAPPTEGRIDAIATSTGDAPPINTVWEWALSILREQADRSFCSFADLGHELKQRHGLDSRAWYGVSLKQLMLQAAQAGLLEVTAIAGVDYAALPSAGKVASPPSVGDAPTVELLSKVECQGLFRFLRELQRNSSFLTFKFVVERVGHSDILARWAPEQIAHLINDLADRQILERGYRTSSSAENGAQYSFTTLAFNEGHPLVTQYLGASPDLQLVSSRLGETWLPLVLRTIATIEERAGTLVQTGSLVYIARSTLIAHGGPALNATAITRLLKQELVEAEQLLLVTINGRDPATDTVRPYHALQLNREHPAVQEALALGLVHLGDGEIRPVQRADELAPA